MMAGLSRLKRSTLKLIAAVLLVSQSNLLFAQGTVSSGSSSFYSGSTLNALWIICAILLIITIMLLVVRSSLIKMVKEKHPEQFSSEPSYFERVLKPKMQEANKTLVVLGVILLFALVGGTYGFKFGLEEVGVQQGYAPTQPINFPHTTHAGEYEIDCQYCHYGVEKGKQAVVPSVNICMNCHNHVTASDKYNGQVSPEIQKIYTAIDYNYETGEYGPNKQPVKWIRIHNLPDLAYFNHSQHVVAGKQECQTCHGPVEEMEKMSQHATLQMGWCVDCHRTTNLSIDNAYYADLAEKIKAEGKDHITVAENGGLECAKCHY